MSANSEPEREVNGTRISLVNTPLNVSSDCSNIFNCFGTDVIQGYPRTSTFSRSLFVCLFLQKNVPDAQVPSPYCFPHTTVATPSWVNKKLSRGVLEHCMGPTKTTQGYEKSNHIKITTRPREKLRCRPYLLASQSVSFCISPLERKT